MAQPLAVGMRRQWTRLISEEDILKFGELSGDQGRHHVERDAEGRLLGQGLLTASLPTKLGGDLNYIAREMIFEFIRAVYSGDTLTATAVVTRVAEQSTRYKVGFTFDVVNQDGVVVMTGATSGQILKTA